MAAESQPQFDLFVAYAEADHAWVEGYLLPALGLPADRLITDRDFHPGASIVTEFERAVASSRCTVLVLSPAFLADEWAIFGEQLASYASVAEQRERLVPLLIEPCELPLHLEFRVRLDCTDEADWESEVARLRALLDQPEPTLERIPCPYPGMVPFSEENAHYFFGREGEIEELRRRLRHHDFLLVIGPSGSGKSSLVSAGLIPSLYERQPGEWLVRTMRPGAAPLVALQTTLGDRLDLTTFQPLPAARPSPRLLLVVDQLEDLFVLASRADQAAFLAALVALRESHSCKLLLILRADFFPDLMSCVLWPVDPGQRVEIAPLRGAALRDAISRPALALGVHLEASLVERLLADATDEPGVLPLLQETLVLLWEKRTRRLLTLSAYQRLGGDGRSGLAVAMAAKADATLAELSPEGQRIAWRILLRLVQFGEGRADTRRQQPVAALRSPGDDSAEFDKVLQHLADNRLLTLGSEAGAGRTVDLAHEALIAGWPRLQRWLAARRAAEQTRRRLAAKAAEWLRLGRGVGGRLDEIELTEAEGWLASPDAAELGCDEALPALVRASREALEQAERDRQSARRHERLAALRLRGLAVVLALLTLVLLGYWVRGWVLRSNARGEMVSIPAGRVTIHVAPKTTASGPVTMTESITVTGLVTVTIPVAPFQLERFEVSNRQYRLCVGAGVCKWPNDVALLAGEGRDDLPVVMVNAFQAAAYCRWLGRRLPTEAEWQWAAQGGQNDPWPWGPQPPTSERANVQFSAQDKTQLMRVNSLPGGASPQKVYHLVGNVMEWTASDYDNPAKSWDGSPDQAPAQLAVHGGSWMTSLDQANPEVRLPARPDAAHRLDLGFRCAADGP